MGVFVPWSRTFIQLPLFCLVDVVEFGVDLHGNTSIITKYQTEKCYGHLKKDDIVLICWFRMYKGLSLTPFCRYFRLSQGSKVSMFIGFEAFLFLRASHESSIDGTVYHSMWLTLLTRSRMVLILWEKIRWASLWTDWSVCMMARWPHVFWGSSGTVAAAPGKSDAKVGRHSHQRSTHRPIICHKHRLTGELRSTLLRRCHLSPNW